MYITSYSIRIVLLLRYVNIYDTMAPMSVTEGEMSEGVDDGTSLPYLLGSGGWHLGGTYT
jgi:hypothetical protein